MARYDALTGLPNRALLMDGLEEALIRAHRLRRVCALMFIDLDRFKSINDTLGHQIGDKLLCEVAHRIEDSTDDGHRIGRLGRSEEHTSELQSLMRNSYAVFCLKKKNTDEQHVISQQHTK